MTNDRLAQDLFGEIVSTDVCCGCAACVLVCPHNVLDYDYSMEKPFRSIEVEPSFFVYLTSVFQ